MKNGSWPSGVTVALLSHSTWMRPAKVSATTGPADIRSITGCSPVGSPGKSPRFLTIPHDNSDLLTDRISPTQGFRLIGQRAGVKDRGEERRAGEEHEQLGKGHAAHRKVLRRVTRCRDRAVLPVAG